MRPIKTVKRWAVYRFARLCLWVLNRLSRPMAQRVGGWIGVTAWRFMAKERAAIDRHLTFAYGGQLTESDRTAIGREFFINSGKNLADFLRFKDHFADQIAPLVEIEGLEHYLGAFEKGRGVIGITGHIGNFELLAAALRAKGPEVAVIAREMYDRRLDRMLVANREAVGLNVFQTTESPRRILKWLHDNKALGVLIDTDSMRVRGEFIDWFGHPANTPIGQALLGLKTGAAFVPMACVRTPDDRYKVIVKEEVTVERTGDNLTDARTVTAACVRHLEAIISEHKAQWIWIHDRWHTRP